MSLVERLYAALDAQPGQRAVDLARKCGCMKQEANRTLHNTPDKFIRDPATNTWAVTATEAASHYYPDIPEVPVLPPGCVVLHDGRADYASYDSINAHQVTDNVADNFRIFINITEGATVVLDIKNTAIRDHALGILLGLRCRVSKVRN